MMPLETFPFEIGHRNQALVETVLYMSTIRPSAWKGTLGRSCTTLYGYRRGGRWAEYLSIGLVCRCPRAFVGNCSG